MHMKNHYNDSNNFILKNIFQFFFFNIKHLLKMYDLIKYFIVSLFFLYYKHLI